MSSLRALAAIVAVTTFVSSQATTSGAAKKGAIDTAEVAKLRQGVRVSSGAQLTVACIAQNVTSPIRISPENFDDTVKYLGMSVTIGTALSTRYGRDLLRRLELRPPLLAKSEEFSVRTRVIIAEGGESLIEIVSGAPDNTFLLSGQSFGMTAEVQGWIETARKLCPLTVYQPMSQP